VNIFRNHACLFIPAVLFSSVQCSQPPDGLWKSRSIDSAGDGADGVHTADINEDGFLDVVSGWEQSGLIKLYLNPGQPGLTNDQSWTVIDLNQGRSARGVEDAAFADLDLDGSIDSVISSVEGYTMSLNIHWLSGADLEAPSSWTTTALVPEQPAGYMKARAGQIDGTGGADIVAGTKAIDGTPAGVYWFQSPPVAGPDNAAEWKRFFIGEVDAKTTTLALRDMDADQLNDIVYSGRYGVGWFRNPGHAVLQQNPEDAVWERIVISDIGSEFTFCDHTGDGSQNLIAVTAQGSEMVAQWFKRLDETGRRWAEYHITSDDKRPGMVSGRKFALKGVACGFVDADDTIDLVFTASGHGYGVFMMSPRSEIAAGDAWALIGLSSPDDTMKYDNLELLDIDNDGDLDITTTEEGGIFSSGQGVLWFENPRQTEVPGSHSDSEQLPETNLQHDADITHD
jgi:hypothetical protein